jgi:LysM repeat protein
VSSSSRFNSGTSGFLSGVQASVAVTVSGIQASVAATRAYQADSLELALEASQIGRVATLQINRTQDLIGQTPPELLSSVQTPSAVARATAYVGATQKSLAQAGKAAHAVSVVSRLRRAASDPTAARIDKASPSDSVATHLAKATDTFASISVRYYGTADRAAAIAKANGVASFRVSPKPGTKLVIPVITSSNSRAKSA